MPSVQCTIIDTKREYIGREWPMVESLVLLMVFQVALPSGATAAPCFQQSSTSFICGSISRSRCAPSHAVNIQVAFYGLINCVQKNVVAGRSIQSGSVGSATVTNRQKSNQCQSVIYRGTESIL